MSVFGLRVESPVTLRWTQPDGELESGRGPIRVRLVATAERPSLRHEPLVSGDDACRLQRLADGRLVADTCDAGPFVLDASAGTIDAPCETVSGPEWEHRLLAYALPYLLGDRGDLILHGAAIDTPNGAVVLLGPSGRGKSTLALAAVAAGHRVLGDDAVRVTFDPMDPSRVTAWPGPAGARSICRDTTGRAVGKDSVALAPSSMCTRSRPIAAVVALTPRSPDGEALRLLSGRDRIGAILNSTFAEHGATARVYAAIATLARVVPIAAISIRDDRRTVQAEVTRALAIAACGAHHRLPPTSTRGEVTK